MFERILAILHKEFKQIFRDPRMRTVIFISPMVQIFIFGYAANTDITNIPTAIYDLDNTLETREFIRDFTYSGYFDAMKYLNSDAQQIREMDGSVINAIIRFNRGFGEDINANKEADVQLVVDGTNSNTASVVLSYAGAIASRYTYQMLQKRYNMNLVGTKVPRVDLRDRAWYNENLISRNFYLPGVIATIVTVMSLLLSAMAIVREKEIGTMEQLIVSPIKPYELILGKIMPFAVIALMQVTLITAVALFWFHLPLKGNIIFLFISTLVYLLTTLGVGLYLSTLCATQQEAMMSMFLFYSPAVLLSGFAYPIANMPKIIQLITYANPLRYFLVIVRSIFLKGVGFNILWPQLWPLLIIGISVITLSSLRFGRRLG